MLYMKKTPLFYVALFSLFFFNNLFSQCAGTDNTITICNKESDVNYQNLNLFNQLGGVPKIGGKWISNNPRYEKALNNNTGILNLWAINQSGEHIFTYTNLVCNQSAEITIHLGGYPGEDNINGGANACSNNSAVELFTFLDNDLVNLTADSNGTWTEDPTTVTGFLTGSSFNAELAGNGTYTFIYTVNPIDTCPSRFATLILEVHRIPEPGEALELIICNTDDLKTFTNVNLLDYLVNEDPNGIWTDDNNTGQIINQLDTTINIQEIYQNFGPGKYDFTYTVFSVSPVCSDESVTVTVVIPKFTAEFLVENQCLNNSLRIDILHDSTLDSEVLYDLEYEIINTSTNIVAHTGTHKNVKINPDGSIENTQITLPNNTLVPGSYTIKTKDINNLTGVICNSFTVVKSDFIIYEAKAKVENICYDKTTIDLTIYNFYDNNGDLFTGTKTTDYTVTSDTQVITTNNAILSFLNGEAIVPIDLSTFPITDNDYNFTFTSTSQSGLNCINHDFMINRIPEDIKLDITVDNACNTTDLKVTIDAPNISDGEYNISYEVVEVATGAVLISNNIVFNSGGNANYDLDITGLNRGLYNVILKSTQNDTTPCRTKFEFEEHKEFSIDGIPEPPTLDANQSFCSSNFHPNVPTLADIIVNSGDNLTWYSDNTSNAPLDISTVLINGESYYVTASSSNNNCESSERTSVTVTIFTPLMITTMTTEPLFCSSENATISNLQAQTNSGNLLWYDAPTNGNLVSPETTLTNGATYYATENINGCESINRLAFNITVIAPPKPEITGTTLLCALEKLTLFDFENSLVNNTGYEFIWYDVLEGGLEINKFELLDANLIYYVASTHKDSACESERIPISVTLNNCDPDKYGFFIPDGFSPNTDGINDFYFIPNIQYFYPSYTLEIFNRYGQKLFSGNVNNPKWNGQNTSSKSDVTSGVYFYILNYNKNNIKPKQGRIYLSK